MANPTTLTLNTSHSQLSPISAFINLSALAYNLTEIQRCLPSTCDVLAVVKADAYGHGAVKISQTLAHLGVRRFGVATVQEGAMLREHGISQDILVMGGLLPSQLSELIHYHLTPVISCEDIACDLSDLLSSHSIPYPVHVKIDTGMRRLGLSLESVASFLKSAPFEKQLRVEGLMTHLADADNSDSSFTTLQVQQFQGVANELYAQGHEIPLLHVANSAGILHHEAAHMDIVRPGIMLYGYVPNHASAARIALRPVMKVTTPIMQVRMVPTGDPLGYNGSHRTTRPSRIAVLPVGYAHGYPRLLSNKGMVLIHGRRAPIVGKICMDMMLVDTTDLPEVHPGEEVVLMGNQGLEEISAMEIAQWAQTIPYEVLCNFGPRVHRMYEPLDETTRPHH